MFKKMGGKGELFAFCFLLIILLSLSAAFNSEGEGNPVVVGHSLGELENPGSVPVQGYILGDAYFLDTPIVLIVTNDLDEPSVTGVNFLANVTRGVTPGIPVSATEVLVYLESHIYLEGSASPAYRDIELKTSGGNWMNVINLNQTHFPGATVATWYPLDSTGRLDLRYSGFNGGAFIKMTVEGYRT